MTRLTEKLLKIHPERPYTANDLAEILPGSNDARYSLVKRALAEGELLKLRRGLYALAPQFRRQAINLFSVAQLIYGPSYISQESALSFHGMIPEAVYATTSACMKKSRGFDTPVGYFDYIRIPQRALFVGVERVDNGSGAVFFMASPLKALSDYLYVRKQSWTGLRPLIESLRIEEQSLSVFTTTEIDDLIGNYSSTRVKRFLTGLKQELAL